MGHPEAAIVCSGNNPVRRNVNIQLDTDKEINSDNRYANIQPDTDKEIKSDNRNAMATCCYQCKGLTVFPLSDLAHNGVHLTHVNVDNNSISQLPAQLYEQLPFLQVFSANGNQLVTLPNEFGQFYHLEELHLCNNNITVLPETFSNLLNLRVLKLNSNHLRKLHGEIGQNKSLEVLSVNENKLNRFPATLGLLTNLSVLEASCNALEVLPATMNFLKSLKFVDLSNNNLTYIPETFGQLTNLTDIDLSENRLSHLCENFQSTKTLQRLYLEHNVFTKCPEWLSDCEDIIEIKMKCNKLSGLAIPEGFGSKSGKLKCLDMRGNIIQKLPISLGCSTFMESLLLGVPVSCPEKCSHYQKGNWLSSLPQNICDLIYLKMLHLEDNQLRDLPVDIGNLFHLEEIFLGCNMLTALPQSFTKLVALKRCQLSDNQLRKLPKDIGVLKMLTELYLDFNKLKSIPSSMKDLNNLEHLDLSNNKMKECPSEIISAFHNLRSLNLSQNKFAVPEFGIPNTIKKMQIHEQADGFNSIFWRSRHNKMDICRQPVILAKCETSACEPESTSRYCRIHNLILEHDSDAAVEWREEPDKFSDSSLSSTSEETSTNQQDLEESWDVDIQHNTNSCANQSGQFDLDDDDDEPFKQMCYISTSRFDSYGNCSRAIHLDISRHLSAPYFYHIPTMKHFCYVPDIEVLGQFDDNDDNVSENAISSEIVGDAVSDSFVKDSTFNIDST